MSAETISMNQFPRLMVETDENTSRIHENLEETYRDQIKSLIEKESERLISENSDPNEDSRLLSLSLIELHEINDPDLTSALMARLGPVRAALEGHGGSIVISSAVREESSEGSQLLSLILDLDGACISCGAAPGTLKGIQDDLLMDSEISSVRFSSSMLEWFNDLQRDFVLNHGGVTFV